MPVANVREIFATHLPKRLKDKPDLFQKVGASYKFVVTGAEAGTWVLDLTQPGGKITEGDGSAQCTITIATPDLLDLMNGKLNGQMAFMTGKLRLAGDLGLALKLQASFG